MSVERLVLPGCSLLALAAIYTAPLYSFICACIAILYLILRLPCVMLDSMSLHYAHVSDFLRVTPNGEHTTYSPAAQRSLLSGWSLLLAGTNVCLQLGQRPVGHGVAKSRVISGSLIHNHVKRTRTTLAYVVISMFGTEAEQNQLRSEINRVHSMVHSLPSDSVKYDAFDPDLQLWVAACLFHGLLDSTTFLYGSPDEALRKELYQHSLRYATGVQVKPEQWPANIDEFEQYWQRKLQTIQYDDVSRSFLLHFISLRFLPTPWPTLIGHLHRIMSTGFLPVLVRQRLQAPWSASDRLIFAVVSSLVWCLNRTLPAAIRAFPLNLVLADTKRRMAAGVRVV
jgi:uncharacterized protein (DUF2236 family)